MRPKMQSPDLTERVKPPTSKGCSAISCDPKSLFLTSRQLQHANNPFPLKLMLINGNYLRLIGIGMPRRSSAPQPKPHRLKRSDQ